MAAALQEERPPCRLPWSDLSCAGSDLSVQLSSGDPMEEQLAGSDSEAAPVACAGSLAVCICPCSEGDNKASPLASAASGSLERPDRPCILMSFSGLSDSHKAREIG